MSKKESGFTLIEIVMVLVLLGILMAVAAPKYFDLQKEARQQATWAIVAEVQSRLNAQFATELLGGQACLTARENAVNTLRKGKANEVKPDNTQTDAWAVTITPETIVETTTSVTVGVKWKGETAAIEKASILPECK